jgi:diguanylate cyclase (GGDEF)-like protein
VNPLDDEAASLFLDAPMGYIVTDLDGTIRHCNAAFARWVGSTVQAVEGTSFVSHLTPGGRLFYETRHLPSLLLKGEMHEVALTLIGAGGGEVDVLTNATVARGATGSAGIRIALLDTVERRHYERGLLEARRNAEESAERLAVLQSAASVIDAAHAMTASVFRPTPEGPIVAIAGEPRPVNEGGPVEHVMASGAPVILRDLGEAEQRYPRYLDLLRRNRIEALVCLPITRGDLLLGALLTTFGRPQELEEMEIGLQRTLAAQASQAMLRVDLQNDLAAMARRDSLTELGNRQALHEELQSAAARRGAGDVLGAIFLDLDGFKAINDRLGHSTGDAVLRQVAARLTDAVRASDTVYRFGGDEFLVMCSGATTDGITAVAERIRARIARPLDGLDVAVTTSIGVAILRGDPGGAAADAMISASDAAMYRSKEAGGNRVTVVHLG